MCTPDFKRAHGGMGSVIKGGKENEEGIEEGSVG